jgi:hypothetical protein
VGAGPSGENVRQILNVRVLRGRERGFPRPYVHARFWLPENKEAAIG